MWHPLRSAGHDPLKPTDLAHRMQLVVDFAAGTIKLYQAHGGGLYEYDICWRSSNNVLSVVVAQVVPVNHVEAVCIAVPVMTKVSLLYHWRLYVIAASRKLLPPE